MRKFYDLGYGDRRLMLTLSARKLPGDWGALSQRSSVCLRLTRNENLPTAAKGRHALLVHSGNRKLDDTFAVNLFIDPAGAVAGGGIKLPNEFQYLDEGDVIRLNPVDQSLRVLYRRGSKHNSLLVTERCNHYCIMCSQPPRDIDDSYIVNELLEAIPLMSQDTYSIGITGGEPTLLGAKFLALLHSLKVNLPGTALHVLSNGRRFTDTHFCKTIAEHNHKNLMFGIPIYSAEPEKHNFVVQSEGAWNETIEGIINLKRFGIRVEIRIVMHKETWPGVVDLAEFIRRNLPMVDHVAFMGLERMGFGITNWNYLFVDPREYSPTLERAVQRLAQSFINVSIYNIALCLLPESLHKFARQSISDWKNDYLETCGICEKKSLCSGFFSSTLEAFKPLVKPFLPEKLART